MKAYLFVETGEVRRPKDGEWVIFEDGDFVLNMDDDYVAEYPILTRHEIEIPSSHNEFHYGTCYNRVKEAMATPARMHVIELPRPKKKVKKTVYLFVRNVNGKTVYSVFENGYEPDGYPVEIEVEE